jgi:hypothetical protein
MRQRLLIERMLGKEKEEVKAKKMEKEEWEKIEREIDVRESN